MEEGRGIGARFEDALEYVEEVEKRVSPGKYEEFLEMMKDYMTQRCGLLLRI